MSENANLKTPKCETSNIIAIHCSFELYITVLKINFSLLIALYLKYEKKISK